LLKALPRKGTQNRRKIKSAILTNTPVKEELAQLEAKRNLTKIKKRVFEKKEKKNNKKKRQLKKKSVQKIRIESDNEDCSCLCCLEPFSNSKTEKKWVHEECMECKKWSHEDCSEGELQYICHNCMSN